LTVYYIKQTFSPGLDPLAGIGYIVIMIIKTISGKRPERMENLEPLFWAYFNNKMMILLMMIENPILTKSALSVEKQKIFLHDLYHHFLPSKMERKYHRAFQWLHLFLDRYPDVTSRLIQRAIRMIAIIYEGFGLKLEKNIESMRIEKERSNSSEGGEVAC